MPIMTIKNDMKAAKKFKLAEKNVWVGFSSIVVITELNKT